MSGQYIRPFANGTEFLAWQAANCEKCKQNESCLLQEALDIASFTDGLISPNTQARLGWRDEYRRQISWPCKAWQEKDGKPPEPPPTDQQMKAINAPRLPF